MGQESERLQYKPIVGSQRTTYYKQITSWILCGSGARTTQRKLITDFALDTTLYKQMPLSLESKSCPRKEKHFLRLVYVF